MTDSTAGESPQGGGPLVITLCSTSVPMMLQLPLLSVFAGLTVFRSRAVEEGRERFRMHLGYFYDLERADRVLAAARRFYPGAFLTEAPQSGMGSLDDTMNAAFQFAKGPAARLVVAERLPEASALDASGGVRDGIADGAQHEPAYDDEVGADAEVAANAAAAPTAANADSEILSAPAAAESASGPGSDLEAPVDAASESGDPLPHPEAAEAVATFGPPPPLPTTVALDATTAILDVALPLQSLLASAAAGAHATEPTAAGGRDRNAVSVQRYAVQLRWSLSPVEPETIPHHALFRQFTLYGVTVQRGNASEHGLRLGFFSNLYSAKQVADYVRHDFPYASVVPVSERELVRAQQAAWNELLARVGVGARRAPESTDDGATRPLRRDSGLRRLWGRQR